MPTSLNGLGWKAFFALLMIFQVISISVIWRTYDAIQETSYATKLNTYQIREVILPRLNERYGYTSPNGPSGK